MKHRKRFLLLSATLATFILSFVPATSFASTTASNVNQTHSQKQMEYEGRTLFRGIVFGQGPVAKLFPQYWEPSVVSKANTQQSVDAVNTLLNQMSKQDPTYFGSLQSAIYSGNPELIDTAFAKGSRLVADSIKSLKMQTSKTTIQDNAVGECIWFAAGYAVAAYTVAGAVNYAVVVNAAGGINAYAVVFVKQWFWPSAVQDSANNELAKEEMIQQMVNTFHS